MPQIEIDLDQYDRIALIAKATQLPLAEVLIALLEITDEFEFEQKLLQLQLDSKMLLADCREHNARMNAMAQIFQASSIRQNTVEPIR